MSIGTRIALVVTLVTSVALGGSLYAVWLAFSATQERQLDGALRAVAADDATRIARGEAPQAVLDRPGPSANDVGPLPQFSLLFEGERLVAASSGFSSERPARRAVDRPRGTFFDLPTPYAHLRGSTVELPGGRLLYVGAPRTDIDSDDAFLASAMRVAFVVALTWVVAITAWSTRRFVRGHERIASTARRVAAGDLAARVGPTDRETAQVALDVDRMIERLALLVDAEKRFIAQAAHELRSPLTTLYGHLQHAASKDREPEDYKELIDEALDSARRLKGTAEDLLALARLGVRTGNEDAGPVAIRDVLERVRAATRSEVEARGAILDLRPSTSHTFGRPADLERLVRNLVENALRYAGTKPRVVVSAEPRGGQLVLAVEDDGKGIPSAERARVFETFYRRPEDRGGDVEGTGLGLPIAREIARAHGGDLTIVDTEKGARFEAVLPLGTPAD